MSGALHKLRRPLGLASLLLVATLGGCGAGEGGSAGTGGGAPIGVTPPPPPSTPPATGGTVFASCTPACDPTKEPVAVSESDVPALSFTTEPLSVF